MAMRNAVQPHLVKHDCSKCGVATPALKAGVVQLHPICPNCSQTLVEQFDRATRQRDSIKQACKRMAREVMTRNDVVIRPSNKKEA